MVYSMPFSVAESCWTRHDLWKALAQNEAAVASMIVNNAFLVTVFPNYLTVMRKADQEQLEVCSAQTELTFRPTIPIGFVRTCPEVKDVNIPPYVLFMDKYKRVSLSIGEFKTLLDAKKCEDISLYAQLITTNRPAIYLSADGPKYL